MEPPVSQNGDDALGKRAKKLNLLFEKYMQRIIQSLSYAKFALCFPELDEHQHDALVMAHKQVCEYLETSMKEDFQNIVAERELLERLNELDQLVEQAKVKHKSGESKKAGTGIIFEPEQALRARTAPLKIAELERLKKQRSELQAENQTLMTAIVTQRDELKGLCYTVSTSLNQFEQVGEKSQF
ncbi:hypothetical protein INT43_003789 [Umbelopsis isabellina]|uniref:Uncharacterized protein n=1 Tax=Mortierella isabellina TaxID=91625 RepID=A0A8H7PTG6_MORIS|nr:hypothetical protein INT43_003789 [Umbelopsis isabellina]